MVSGGHIIVSFRLALGSYLRGKREPAEGPGVTPIRRFDWGTSQEVDLKDT